MSLTPRYNTGVIKNLIDQIPEAYFDVRQEGQVEIIGWLYQFYNEEPKAEVISLPKSHKYRKNQIARATQIFTPDWIVKYMVQNSLGKYWIHHLISNGDVRSEKQIAQNYGWQYYMEDAKQNDDSTALTSKVDKSIKNISVKDIKIIDPAMGSGHILVYSFDLLIQIYESEGYSSNDSVKNILNKNLYGLEIDTRAYQLAYFALVMKAREYSRKAFKNIESINLFTVSKISEDFQSYNDVLSLYLKSDQYEELNKLRQIFNHNNSLGSLLNVDKINVKLIKNIIDSLEKTQNGQLSYEIQHLITIIKNYYSLVKILQMKFHIIIANPPYMGSARMNKDLLLFSKKFFPNSKSDLYSMFIEKWNMQMLPGGYNAMVTMQSWMFLSSFEKMRISLLDNYTISNLMHMENNVMGIAFGTAVTIFRNMINPYFVGTYHQIKTQDISDDNIPQKLPIIGNRYNRSNQTNFQKIPGSPIAYWASDNLIHDFEVGTTMRFIAESKVGLQTGDNNKFIRQWFEVKLYNVSFDSHSIEESINSHKKWFPYNKGGAYRKWYGNYDYVVNWENNGYEIRNFKDENDKTRSRPQNTEYYFREAITWSLITSGKLSLRYRQSGSIHDVSGMSAFSNTKENLLIVMSILNSKVGDYILKLINPTINLQVGDLKRFPILKPSNSIEKVINKLVIKTKLDWDSFETSWDFQHHPFLNHIAEHNLSPPYFMVFWELLCQFCAKK
ncbi:MAG: BREX-1 system adenine-specific DNA-methyltransferase PglX [Lactobacillus sp.]|nr:BREX-1 system adenine-specific DNA-methyltransferase PglX [Lactobacillus sp.]